MCSSKMLIKNILRFNFINYVYICIDYCFRMAAYTKAFTGLTGMAVAKNPTHTLGVLYRYGEGSGDG